MDDESGESTELVGMLVCTVVTQTCSEFRKKCLYLENYPKRTCNISGDVYTSISPDKNAVSFQSMPVFITTFK